MKYLIIALLFFSKVNSQNISGKVEYMASVDYEVYRADQKNILQKNPKFVDIIRENLKATKNVNYELIFKNNKSEFNYISTLDSDNLKGVNYTKILAGNGGIYTSLDPKIILRKNRYFPEYVIKEEPTEWILENTKKNISGFLCYKATANRRISTSSGDKNLKIIAWYTKEIPVSFGPNLFSGLPGLIIELTDNRGLTFEYIKFSKNNINEDEIIKPTGEIVSNDKFQLKIKELKEKYN